MYYVSYNKIEFPDFSLRRTFNNPENLTNHFRLKFAAEFKTITD